MNTPFEFHKKKIRKSLHRKKYTHIFCLSLDSNPRTSKMISICSPAPKPTQPQSLIENLQVNSLDITNVIQTAFFKMADTREHKELAKNCLLVIVVLFMDYKLEATPFPPICKCYEKTTSAKKLLSKLKIWRTEKFFWQ